MRTLHPPKAAAVLLGILVILFAFPVSTKSQMQRSSDKSLSGQGTLPFSFEQVVSYFNDVFEKPGYRLHDNIRVYIERDVWEESVLIAVSAKNQRIAVTLVASGDWGVNYMREFFEAPFFRRSESEQFYTLLSGNHGSRSTSLDRFDVEIGVLETQESIVITAEFAPPGSYQSPLVL